MKSAENVVEKGGLVFLTQKLHWAKRFKFETVADGTSFKLLGKKKFEKSSFPGYEHRISTQDASAELKDPFTYIYIKE